MPKVEFFEYTPGGRNVIEKFIKSELKRLPAVQQQLLDQLSVLEKVPTAVLRENGSIEHVDGEILSFRFKAKLAGNIWIRLLMACWPDDGSICILQPVNKKRNKLDPDDVRQAQRNLQILKDRGNT